MAAAARACPRAAAECSVDTVRRHRICTLRLLRLDYRHTEHRCARSPWPALLEFPRDAAVLTEPGRDPDRTQSSRRRHAYHRQLSRRRLPQHARRHHALRRYARRDTSGAGLRHLCTGQVAPLPGRGEQRCRAIRRLAATAWFRPLLWLSVWRHRPVLSGTYLRQSPHRPAPHTGGGLPRHRGSC